MNTTADTASEVNFADFENTLYTPQFVADCFGITTRRLKDIVDENGVEVKRVMRGTVSARVYTLQNLFELASIRREKGYVKGLGRQIIISTFVQKGGTAKTTTAVNLAIYLQMSGLRVLLIDNDPQGDSSCMLGYDPDLMPSDLEDLGIPSDRFVDGNLGNLIAPLLRVPMFKSRNLDEVIRKPFGPHGLHLLPAENQLDDLAFALEAQNNPDWWYSEWIGKSNRGEMPGCDLTPYDVIIFDNPPSANRLTKNSIAASDMLLCPVRLDKFSFRALNRLNDWIARFAADYKWRPAVAVVPTMFIKNRNRLLANLMTLNDLFPGSVTDGKILFSEDYPKSMDQGFPLLTWKGATAQSMDCARDTYKEVLGRIRQIAQGESA